MATKSAANRSEPFGRLLSGMISSLAYYEGKTSAAVEEELGMALAVVGKTIQRYKSGYLPPSDEAVRLLAEAAVRRGFLGREWLQRFLHAARYPFAEQLLDALCPAPQVRPRPPRVYENLPAPTYSQFVMRELAFAEVTDGLSKRTAAVLIVGLGGNGKTSLAREVAAGCLRDDGEPPRFDAVVWVSDKDRPGTTNLSTVLDEIARTLDYPGFTQFEHDEKRREVEQLLRRQRVLLVVDNFETITDGALLTWLLNLPEPSKALITTREYRREFRRSSWPVELRGMSEEEVRTLIDQRLRQLRMEKLVGSLEQLEPLITATGGNPKAIEITLGLVKHERRPLQEVVDDIYAARGDLFDDLFTRAWALLDEAARRVLLVATFFPTSASGEALSATADVQGFAFDRAVERLADMALLDVQQADLSSLPRYTLHPLVRAFAGAKLGEQAGFEAGVRERWVQWCRVITNQHGLKGWNLAEQFNNAELDMPTFHAVIQYCYETRRWTDLIEMVPSIKSYWTTRGYFETRNRFVNLALEAAEHLHNVKALILLLAIKIRTLCRIDDVDSAVICLNRARILLEDITNPEPRLVESLNEADIRICSHQENIEKQLMLARENVISASMRDTPDVIFYRYYIADSHFRAGNDDKAESLFVDLIEESEAHQFNRATITGWFALAQIAIRRHNLDEAVERLEKACTLAQEFKHRPYLGEIQRVWAQVYTLRGDLPAARVAFAEAIDLFERLGMRRKLAESRQALADLA